MPTPLRTIQALFNPRHNSFDFLRFLLATGVVLVHCHPLGGFPSGISALLYQQYLAVLLVPMFFGISGFLITRSFLTASSTGRYLWHRALRILPAYWVCLLLCAGILVPTVYVLENGGLAGFTHVTGPSAVRYLVMNSHLKQRQYPIEGIWETAPYPGAMNASLWSLYPEAKRYLLIAILGGLGVLRSRRYMVGGLLAAFWGLSVLGFAAPGAEAGIVPFLADGMSNKLTLWFLAGTFFFLYQDRIVLSHRYALAALVLTVSASFAGLSDLVAPLTVTYLLLWLAVYLPFQRFGRYGDFSYGLYIYGFPMQQLLSSCGVNQCGFLVYFLASMTSTLAMSIVSYRLVEKRALQLKSVAWPAWPNTGASPSRY